MTTFQTIVCVFREDKSLRHFQLRIYNRSANQTVYQKDAWSNDPRFAKDSIFYRAPDAHAVEWLCRDLFSWELFEEIKGEMAKVDSSDGDLGFTPTSKPQPDELSAS